MKMKKLIKILDPLTYIEIWTDEPLEDDEPNYEGYLLDMPWYFLNYEIGRPPEDSSDEPIYVSIFHNIKTQRLEPVVVINLIAK